MKSALTTSESRVTLAQRRARMRVEVAPSIVGLRGIEWAGYASWYVSPPWLTWVEVNAGAEVQYVVARCGGSPVGVLPVYFPGAESDAAYDTGRLLGGVSGQHAVAGNYRGYTNELVTRPGSSQASARQVAIRALVDGASTVAIERGRTGVAFLYLTTDAARALVDATSGAVPVLMGLDTELTTQGRCFEDYLKYLEQAALKRRAEVVREMASFSAAGYDVRVERLSQCWYDAGPLVAQVQAKYGHRDTAETCRFGLASQADTCDTHTVVFTARRAGRLVACALFYAWREWLYGRVVGFDYPLLADAYEYFNLYVYRPLRYAYEHGYRGLRLGTGSYVAKVRRGATPLPRWGVLLPDVATGDYWRDCNTRYAARVRGEWKLRALDIPRDWLAGAV